MKINEVQPDTKKPALMLKVRDQGGIFEFILLLGGIRKGPGES